MDDWVGKHSSPGYHPIRDSIWRIEVIPLLLLTSEWVNGIEPLGESYACPSDYLTPYVLFGQQGWMEHQQRWLGCPVEMTS